MSLGSAIVIILGLGLFETVSSIDNAVINAEVLRTMSPRGRRWFLIWGLLFAVVVVRGLLPWMIVFFTTPSLGLLGSFTATFSGNPAVHQAIESSAPTLLTGGGTFLILLFLHWLFLEPKAFGLRGEHFFFSKGVWFYALASIFLAVLVWIALGHEPMMAFAATIGSSAFFITSGFKQNAEASEEKLLQNKGNMSDLSKILYLEIIDTTFSIDGVLGAFAFTLAVPLILLGNGIGALVVRHLTVGNIERIQQYVYLKNGAMYSIFGLGVIMLADAFGMTIPSWVSPLVTLLIIGFFFFKSKKAALASI